MSLHPGDIDVERTPLSRVLAAEAGPPPRTCDTCPQDVAIFLDRSRHRWDCPNHPRHGSYRERLGYGQPARPADACQPRVRLS